jgi:Xaa-Pro aminopeptidase
MDDVIIYGDTIRSADMRHEVAVVVPDPFLYLETGGRRHVAASSMELPRIAEVHPDLELHDLQQFGWDELVASGATRPETELEVSVRACRDLGMTNAAVPPEFPLALADRLRAAGISVQPNRSVFEARRRVKSAAELAGIRRAQRAAEAGMGAAAELLRAARPDGDGIVLDGEALSSERIKAAIRDAADRAGGSMTEAFIVSHGAQAAVGHELGSGAIRAGEPVIIDLWPRDPQSGCYADMTRTFVVGEVPEELRRYHELCLEALRSVQRAVRGGLAGSALFGLACEPFEQAGLPTQRTKADGETLEEGFFHSLGHGVGLEVHEAPMLGRAPDVLVAGDVVAVEPGCYRPGFGGCRLEDLVHVTEDGGEVLTDFPYELTP